MSVQFEDLCKCDREVKVCVFMRRFYLYVHAGGVCIHAGGVCIRPEGNSSSLKYNVVGNACVSLCMYIIVCRHFFFSIEIDIN